MIESRPDWRKLLTPGHVWVARLNATRWVGGVLLAGLVGAVTLDVLGNTVWLSSRLAAVSTGEPTFWERLRVAPWQTLRGTVSSAAVARPTLDPVKLAQLTPAGRETSFDPAALTTPTDLAGYVAAQIVALNASGTLDPKYGTCDPIESLIGQTWLNSKNGQPDVPRCKRARDGSTVWLFSVVGDGDAVAQRAMPWAGVFHKTADGWKFFNIAGIGSAMVPGHAVIRLDNVARQVEADWPELTVKRSAR